VRWDDLGFIHTAMSHENHAMLCDVACRTNEAVVLEATDAHRVVRDHVRQDQLSAARCTTHRHAYPAVPVVYVGDAELRSAAASGKAAAPSTASIFNSIALVHI
jgi:hypothetical protein